jgi:hypothetical protein
LRLRPLLGWLNSDIRADPAAKGQKYVLTLSRVPSGCEAGKSRDEFVGDIRSILMRPDFGVRVSKAKIEIVRVMHRR